MAENLTPPLIVNAEEEPSDVLHQLDQLLNKHRSAQDSAAQVPTLTETLDEAPQADIPVLQDEAAVATTSDDLLRSARKEIMRLELHLCQALRRHLEQAARNCPESFTIDSRAEFQVVIEDLIRQLPAKVHRVMLDALKEVSKT
jgi:hypothetical protein